MLGRHAHTCDMIVNTSLFLGKGFWGDGGVEILDLRLIGRFLPSRR